MHNDTTPLTTKQQTIIDALTLPMTVTQLAHRTQIRRYLCSRQLRKLARQGYVRCLTPETRSSRVYGLTPRGNTYVQATNPDQAQECTQTDIDWQAYGRVCFSQRAAVLKALDEPLQPAAIKRKALRSDPTITMSANNVRDVINAFAANGIVEPLFLRKKAHPRYQLTTKGQRLQEHLLKVTTPRPAT